MHAQPPVLMSFEVTFAQDCSSPLFLAVSANAYPTALALIKKGANVDAIRVSPDIYLRSVH